MNSLANEFVQEEIDYGRVGASTTAGRRVKREKELAYEEQLKKTYDIVNKSL